MNIDTTSSSAPAPNLISSAPSGLSVSKVQVITSPQTITTPIETVDASIHAPSNVQDKGKSVEFSNPARAPSSDASKASVQSSSSRYHAAAYVVGLVVGGYAHPPPGLRPVAVPTSPCGGYDSPIPVPICPTICPINI
ncbi:unnamed protein product [Rhizophagus irregularis]|nr:unnamed protein product [Rhizophagus irregularis]